MVKLKLNHNQTKCKRRKDKLQGKKEAIILGTINTILLELFIFKSPIWFKIFILITCFAVPLIMVEIKGRDINNKERGVVISITLAIFLTVYYIKDGLPLAVIITFFLSMISIPIILKRNNYKYLISVIQCMIFLFIFLIIGIVLQMFAEGIGLVN